MAKDPNAPREARPQKNASPTARGSAPPVVAAVRMEPVVLWVIQRCDDFPKKHRFSVGDRWIDTCLDVQTSLVEAAYIRDKRALLHAASRGLVRARVLARLASSLHAISLDQQAHFDKESLEVGRMVGGWLRALATRPGAPQPQQDVGPAGTP